MKNSHIILAGDIDLLSNSPISPDESEWYSFGIIRPFRPSVRSYFLSVPNHISVPIGQIWCILGINDKYHIFSISYKLHQNGPLKTCLSIGNYNTKPIFAILCNYLHISSKLIFLRAIAGNTTHIEIFLLLCIQFVLCMDCQFMKKKGYVTMLNF